MMLHGKSAIITGASQGLGLEIARHFVREGAHVTVCARSGDLLSEAVCELTQMAPPGVRVVSSVTDVSDAAQVKALRDTTVRDIGYIDILVANAGVHGPKGPVEQLDPDAWSQAIDINLKGSFLLSQAVLPLMKRRGHGKIIFLSGGGATKPFPGLSAYAASKAGLVRFAETLAEEVREWGIDVNSVAPGAMNTRLLTDVLEAGPEKIGEKMYQEALQRQASGGTAPAKGAALCVFLASNISDGITGRLISAVWDPWKSLPDYREDILNTDIYTLRRIIPADRSKAWGDVT